jgi:hypothetical protein
MLAKNTAEEIRNLVNLRDDEGTQINAVNRRTGKFHSTIVEDAPIDTDAFRYVEARIAIMDNYVMVDRYDLEISTVRDVLALVRKAKRSKKNIVIEEGSGNNPTDYTIIAKRDGSLVLGCQSFTAEEVEFVAGSLPKARK